MPGLAMDNASHGGNVIEEFNENYGPEKDGFTMQMSPRSPLSPGSPQSGTTDLYIDCVVDTSIEQLYHNVYEMQSSVHSQSRASFGSYSEESRIDSELNHLVGAVERVELRKEMVEEIANGLSQDDENLPTAQNIEKKKLEGTKQSSISQKDSESSRKSIPISKSYWKTGNRNEKKAVKPDKASSVKQLENDASSITNFRDGTSEPSNTKLGLDNANLGLLLLKQARDMLLSGEHLRKALKVALRAVKTFELCVNGKLNLELIMSLHILAAIYCRLGKHNEAVPILERSIDIPAIEDGEDHALAKFSGCMQLGDTYANMGQLENSLLCYTAGLEIQKQVLGENDPRVGETCRYLAEAHVQALQFQEAEKLCQLALDIHRKNGSPASLEEAADRRLMGLICDSIGNHESALEHYVLASMTLSSNGQDMDVALIDRCIGDAYLSLARFDEAIFAFQKALKVFKSAKGHNHPVVASVFVRLADLYNKIGKFRESISYCESALKIYSKPYPGVSYEEIANGLIDIAAVYQSMDELKLALKLLRKALKIYGNAPSQQYTVAGIEAQIGVMYYIMGNYSNSYTTFKSAITKFRASSEKKAALFGIALNQMGLACVQLYAINEAAALFEEAKSILEKEYGPDHPETLGVLSNLAGTYDAMGRLDDAIEILEHVVGMREEKLGTANPDVDYEKQRLAELLKEAGRARNKKSRPLESLLVNYPEIIYKIEIEEL